MGNVKNMFIGVLVALLSVSLFLLTCGAGCDSATKEGEVRYVLSGVTPHKDSSGNTYTAYVIDQKGTLYGVRLTRDGYRIQSVKLLSLASGYGSDESLP